MNYILLHYIFFILEKEINLKKKDFIFLVFFLSTRDLPLLLHIPRYNEEIKFTYFFIKKDLACWVDFILLFF